MSLFSVTLQEKIQKRLARAESPQCAILPILQDVQDELDFVDDEHMRALAAEYKLPLNLVEEVTHFYSMMRHEKGATFQISCCDSPSCLMMGAKETIRALEQRAAKHATGTFSVEAVPCLGVCGVAPTLLVNKDRHHNVTADKVDALLDQYQKAGTNHG